MIPKWIIRTATRLHLNHQNIPAFHSYQMVARTDRHQSPLGCGMHLTLRRDHVVLALVLALLVALWPSGSLVPLAEAALYVAPLALFVGSLSLIGFVERRSSA